MLVGAPEATAGETPPPAEAEIVDVPSEPLSEEPGETVEDVKNRSTAST
jgi:hypothetical protein